MGAKVLLFTALSLVVLCTTLIPSSSPKDNYDRWYEGVWYEGEQYDVGIVWIDASKLSEEELMKVYEHAPFTPPPLDERSFVQ